MSRATIHPNGDLDVDGTRTNHTGIVASYDIRSGWSALVSLPLFDLSANIEGAEVMYVASVGADGAVEDIRGTGATVPEALRALADAMEAR